MGKERAKMACLELGGGPIVSDVLNRGFEFDVSEVSLTRKKLYWAGIGQLVVIGMIR